MAELQGQAGTGEGGPSEGAGPLPTPTQPSPEKRVLEKPGREHGAPGLPPGVTPHSLSTSRPDPHLHPSTGRHTL